MLLSMGSDSRRDDTATEQSLPDLSTKPAFDFCSALKRNVKNINATTNDLFSPQSLVLPQILVVYACQFIIID